MPQEGNARGYAGKKMERAVRDGAGPWTNGAYRLVVPNCWEAKEIVILNLILLCFPNHSLWMIAFSVDLEKYRKA